MFNFYHSRLLFTVRPLYSIKTWFILNLKINKSIYYWFISEIGEKCTTYKNVSNITDLNDCKQIKTDKNHNDDIGTTLNIELNDMKNTGKHQYIINIIIIFS